MFWERFRCGLIFASESRAGSRLKKDTNAIGVASGMVEKLCQSPRELRDLARNSNFESWVIVAFEGGQQIVKWSTDVAGLQGANLCLDLGKQTILANFE